MTTKGMADVGFRFDPENPEVSPSMREEFWYNGETLSSKLKPLLAYLVLCLCATLLYGLLATTKRQPVHTTW